MKTSKTTKLSNDDKAAARVLVLLEKGVIVHGHAAAGTCTVGPHRKAVGPAGFALFGYGRYGKPQDREYATAEQAAYGFVSACGSTRAREAAIAAEKKIANG